MKTFTFTFESLVGEQFIYQGASLKDVMAVAFKEHPYESLELRQVEVA